MLSDPHLALARVLLSFILSFIHQAAKLNRESVFVIPEVRVVTAKCAFKTVATKATTAATTAVATKATSLWLYD